MDIVATDTSEHPEAPDVVSPPTPGSTTWAGSALRRRNAVIAAGALGASCAYIALVDPSSSAAYPQCPLKLLTGLDCAFCGGLRATHALLTGQVGAGLDHNILVVLLAPFALYAGVQWFLAQWGVPLRPLPTRTWMAWVLLGVALAYSVVRNMPWGPGPWLASGIT
jgi:hypothetical protein